MSLIVGLNGCDPTVIKDVISIHQFDDLLVFDIPDSAFLFAFNLCNITYLEVTND